MEIHGELFAPGAVDEEAAAAGIAPDPAVASCRRGCERRASAAGSDAEEAGRRELSLVRQASTSTAIISATCWPRCSSCSGPIPARSGSHDRGARQSLRPLRPPSGARGVADSGRRARSGDSRCSAWSSWGSFDTCASPTTGGVTVGVSPTYTGCPATEVIARSIEIELEAEGYRTPKVESVLSPPWTQRLADRERARQAQRVRHRTASSAR